jgi:membrane protease YdiL (CAAX protease family)
MYLVSLFLLFFNVGANPNDEIIIEHIKINPNTMIAVTVLLGPVVEETLFRGVVFGTIRRKNRTAAYLVSFIVFAVYHLWEYILVAISTTGASGWSLILNLLQYLPGSLALAWCYERSNTLWAPIFLHMLINALNISVIL